MSKHIEQYIPITGRNKEMARNPSGCINEPTHIKLSLYYSLGGGNLFTGKTEPRGYYISADVEQRSALDIGSSVCCLLGSGVKQCVLEVNRQSDKQKKTPRPWRPIWAAPCWPGAAMNMGYCMTSLRNTSPTRKSALSLPSFPR